MKRIKLIFLTTFIFILFLGTISEANSNLTLKDFKEIIKADGYNMDNVTFPSYFNQLLNNNPIIFYNQDKTKIMCFTGIVKANSQKDYYPNITLGIYNNRYVIGYQYENVKTYNMKAGYYSFEGYNIIDTDTYPNRYRIGYSINLSDYSFETISSGYNGYNYYSGGVYPYIGYDYSYYQNDYTLDKFKTLSFIKSQLANNMIFYGKSLYYSDNDIFYKFNGVFKGNDFYKPISSEFTINTSMSKFEYEAFEGYSDEYVTINSFYLQQFTPNSAVKIDDTYFTLQDLTEQDSLIVKTGRKAQFNFLNLKKLMEKGYIYRLVAHSKASKNDVSGETDSYSTSCFFSLDSWKSTAIEVININKFLNAESSEIEIIPSDDDNKSEDNNIISSIINGNEKYWGTSGEIDPKETENNIKNNINELMKNMSGELSKNEIFKALEGAEKGFFELLKNRKEEKMYDLKLNWKKTEYQGTTLLEDGEINILKMCREIPELARLQEYIRIIFNFTAIINIIKQIYNLVLATLGIDNPFLYEQAEVVTSVDTDTGEYKQYNRRKKRIL